MRACAARHGRCTRWLDVLSRHTHLGASTNTHLCGVLRTEAACGRDQGVNVGYQPRGPAMQLGNDVGGPRVAQRATAQLAVEGQLQAGTAAQGSLALMHLGPLRSAGCLWLPHSCESRYPGGAPARLTTSSASVTCMGTRRLKTTRHSRTVASCGKGVQAGTYGL